jgi:pilus assembly protein CpaE
VLVDLDPQPQQMLPQLERIVARFPTSRFVALASTLENDLLVEAMQTGIRRVVVKHSMQAELAKTLDRISAVDAADGNLRGDVITILSASGGCGATTLAVNLAEEIAIKQTKPTLLVDLDSCYGALASYLGLNPRYAIDHILGYADQIDDQLIRSTATVHSEKLHLLASPSTSNFADAGSLDLPRFESAIEASRKAYGTTIIDAPRIPLNTAASLVSSSKRTLLVFPLTVKDLRTGRAMLDALRARGIDVSNVIPLANRYVKRQMIGLEEASKALGGPEIRFIRNDWATAIQGMNYGQLLSEAGPRSTLRKDLQELVTQL